MGGLDCPAPFAPQQPSVPTVLIPQLWEPPALTAGVVNESVGMLSSWPEPPSPQQASTPDVRIAQVNNSPPPTPANVPVGALVWPEPLKPQQASAPEVRIAQVCP